MYTRVWELASIGFNWLASLQAALKGIRGELKMLGPIDWLNWTEPHSQCLRISLTIQQEVFTVLVLEQVFEIEYLVQHGQCPDCAKLPANNIWKALVQRARKDTISVKEVCDGLDFFYSTRSHAQKMAEFLTGVVPIQSKVSRPNGSSRRTHTPTLPTSSTPTRLRSLQSAKTISSVSRPSSLANISPLTLCVRMGNSLHFVGPATLQSAEISAPVYWCAPFESLASVADFIEFTVLDVEPLGMTRSKWVLADAQVALSGAFCSHGGTRAGAEEDDAMDYEGGPGDSAMGYFLTNTNFNLDDFAALPSHRMLDVELVKKAHPNRRKKNKPHGWKFRSMGKEAGKEGETGAAGAWWTEWAAGTRRRSRTKRCAGRSIYKEEGPREFDMDVDELAHAPDAGTETDGEAEEQPDFPEVKFDELLEDLDEMTLEEDLT
ncbi:hypothetical protein BD311DRAFT_833909 [Dichomitus squalens]|uniref:60S ribosomal export protein NMD3 n=1 Tax=Dichomitus squalens TaxID=114155 RepID=A0A4Q9M342_9APHY|nr:hypothetical protein BD311DRAFT_833909 [Dichomitus squalens]